MNLTNSIIANLLPDLPPEVKAPSRFFLVAFIQKFGTTGWSEEPLKPLAESLKVSDRVASTALQELQKCGCLDARKLRAGPGRQTYGYRLSRNGYCRLGDTIGPVDKGHEELIRELLTKSAPGDLSQDGGDKRHDFGPPSPDTLDITGKLLLVLLLAEATPCGVITERSHVWLAKKLGVPVQRVRRQLRKLWRLGYLRNVVSGMVSTGGIRRCPSLYFLNLAHPTFGGKWAGRVFIVDMVGLASGVGSDCDQQGQMCEPEVSQLVKALADNGDESSYAMVQYETRGVVVPFPLDSRVSAMLKSAENNRVESYLQGVLDNLVGRFLTRNANPIGHQPLPLNDTQIRREIVSSLVAEGGRGRNAAESSVAAILASWILFVAREKASGVARILAPAIAYIPVRSSFVLLPSAGVKGQPTLKLLVAPYPGKTVEPGTFRGCWGQKHRVLGHVEKVRLTHQEQYEVGLLLKPPE